MMRLTCTPGADRASLVAEAAETTKTTESIERAVLDAIGEPAAARPVKPSELAVDIFKSIALAKAEAVQKIIDRLNRQPLENVEAADVRQMLSGLRPFLGFDLNALVSGARTDVGAEAARILAEARAKAATLAALVAPIEAVAAEATQAESSAAAAQATQAPSQAAQEAAQAAQEAAQAAQAPVAAAQAAQESVEAAPTETPVEAVPVEAVPVAAEAAQAAQVAQAAQATDWALGPRLRKAMHFPAGRGVHRFTSRVVAQAEFGAKLAEVGTGKTTAPKRVAQELDEAAARLIGEKYRALCANTAPQQLRYLRVLRGLVERYFLPCELFGTESTTPMLPMRSCNLCFIQTLSVESFAFIVSWIRDTSNADNFACHVKAMAQIAGSLSVKFQYDHRLEKTLAAMGYSLEDFGLQVRDLFRPSHLAPRCALSPAFRPSTLNLQLRSSYLKGEPFYYFKYFLDWAEDRKADMIAIDTVRTLTTGAHRGKRDAKEFETETARIRDLLRAFGFREQ